MGELWKVFLLALIPAAGVVVGGVVGELMTISRKVRSLALHAAAGIVLAVVAVELMPEAITAEPQWAAPVAFAAGGLFFVGIDRTVELISSHEEGSGSGAWMILIAVAVDLFSDGVMVGTGSTVRFDLALMLAIAQIPGNFPEGFATVATMRRAGVTRMARAGAFLGLAIIALVGAMAGYFLLRNQPLVWRMATLAFTAGILTTAVVEEIIPESHEKADARTAVLFFIGGFVLFMFITSYTG